MKTIIPYLLSVIVFCSCAGKHSKIVTQENTSSDSAIVGMVDLSSVKAIPVLLCQNWVYKDDAADYDSSAGSLDIPYRSFSFFVDSTVVKQPHEDIQFGKWSFNNDDKTILIKYENGKIENYKIKAIGVKDLTLIKQHANKEEIVLVADGKQEQNFKKDPFYVSNNRWRIRPTHEETDKELKERIKEYLQFYALFFNDNINRSATAILFHGLPSCFYWYNGGIGLQEKDKIDYKWVGCFYNYNQAMQAYDTIANLIQKNYQWNKDETNWVKQTAPVLQQMCDSLK